MRIETRTDNQQKPNRALQMILVSCFIALSGLQSDPVFAQGVKVSIWRPIYADRTREFFDKTIPLFMKENPAINVEIIDPGAGGKDWYRTLQMWAAARNEPNVFLVYPFNVVPLADAGILLPLDTYIDKELRADIPERLWTSNRWQGKVYGVPSSFGSYVLFYNKTILAKAGLDPRKPPSTWNDFLAVAKQIVQRTGIPAVGMNAKARVDMMDTLFPSIYHSFTNRPFLDDNGAPLFNTPDGATALKYWADLYRVHKVTQAYPLEYDKGDLRLAFRDGKVAMIIDGPWILPLFKGVQDMGSEASSPIGVALNPKATVSSGTIHPGAWVISSRSKYPEATWKLVRFLMRPEWQYENDVLLGQAPSLKSEYSMPEFQKWYWKPFITSIESGYDKVRTKNGDAFYDMFIAMMQKVLLGQVSPEKALAEAEQQVKASMR